MSIQRTRSEQARINSAKSSGPKTPQGLQKCREAAIQRGLLPASSPALPSESNEAFQEVRRHVHGFWVPRTPYESTRVERLALLAWEANRIESSRRDLLLQAMAEVRQHDPSLASAETLTARTETRIASSVSYHKQDRRLRDISSETSRIERDLIRLRKQPIPPKGSQMSLETNEPSPLGPAKVLPMPEPPPPPDILAWAQSHFQFQPNEAQKQLLTDTTGRVLLCAARQTGKSTAAALKIAYQALHHPDSLILIAAPSGRQSAQLLEKARRYAAQVTELKGASRGTRGFRLPNGSEVIALPDNVDTVRGYSDPKLIVIDDAAHISEELFAALLPALAVSNGALLLLGTPNGQSGIFSEQWHHRKAAWARILLRAADCPHIQPEWLAAMRLQLGERHYRQQFECEFLPGPGQIFPLDLIQRCLSDDVEPFTTGDEPL